MNNLKQTEENELKLL